MERLKLVCQSFSIWGAQLGAYTGDDYQTRPDSVFQPLFLKSSLLGIRKQTAFNHFS